MKLLVVYGLKTRDKAWLDRFYPARRLSGACANRSIPLRFLFPHEVSDSLPGTFEVDDFPPADTVCLVRGTVPDETWRVLKNAGYRCVNSREAAALALDKLETARFLERHGWPTPLTAEYHPDESNPLPIPFPLVLKPRFGSRGEGVELIENETALAVRKMARKTDEPADACADARWIIQEYIESSRGKDLRTFFAGGEILATVERHGSPDDFRSNACTGGTMRAAETGGWMDRWMRMTLDIARDAGLWYGTVDFLYRNGQELTVCEINGAPGFEALERDLGLDIAGELVERLVRDFG